MTNSTYNRLRKIVSTVKKSHASGTQAVVVRGHGLPGRLAQVLPQVEPVGDLDRLRGPGADAVGIRAGPVPANGLDLGVLAQPGGEGAGLAVGQHVHRLVGVHVDQDGVV
jgi:hypothetical protein